MAGMRKDTGLFFLLIIFGSVHLYAQKRYWIEFKDKGGVEMDREEYFEKSFLREKLCSGENCYDFYDLPLREDYCHGIQEITEIKARSRWMNAVSAEMSNSQKDEIAKLHYVKAVYPIRHTAELSFSRENRDEDPELLEHIKNQTQVLGGDLFNNKGIVGKGIRIAVFDGGFPGVDTLSYFRHLREENRIVATWDFVHDEENVYDYNSHGTTVLGCIAGIAGDLNIGLAPGAEFLLARTEVTAEIFEEEENWAEAMEWAYRNGADIISSSLGYTHHRYFPRDMDGETVFVTRIARIAARKGILVINSAGNEGDSDWQVIGAPADADSILSVGGISGETGIHISFSSFGPSFDKRIKPNVVAFGDAVSSGKTGLKTAYGTSFSAPLVSGFAACVMEMYPDWDNIKVLREIEKSGHLYPYYDYAHGYGVPQAAYFLHDNEPAIKTFDLIRQVDVLQIKILQQEYTGESTIARERHDKLYLYYHIADSESGVIRRYRVVKMEDADTYNIPYEDIQEGENLRVYYNGHTEEFVR